MMFVYDLVFVDDYKAVYDIVRSCEDILEYLVACLLEFFAFLLVCSWQISLVR
jgi:hypothetical protein